MHECQWMSDRCLGHINLSEYHTDKNIATKNKQTSFHILKLIARGLVKQNNT